MAERRSYRMTKRAENVEETRQKIVDAAMRLHETAGLAATTFAGVAEAAGVARLTVYRHFPDADALFAACSAHWWAKQVPPDPRAWARATSPAQRLRVGLADLYRFYRDGEAMLIHVHAERQHLPEAIQRQLSATEARQLEVLLDAFSDEAPSPLLNAVVAHAASFWTWHSLCAGGAVPNDDAVDLMTSLVMSAAAKARAAGRGKSQRRRADAR